MLSKTEATDLINDIFEEEALALGGLIAVHELEDDLVWRWVKNLDLIREKALLRLKTDSRLQPHPAIEDFLASVRGS